MKTSLKALVIFVIFVHFMFFILEAIFWMDPFVHNILLAFLDNPVIVTYPVQALTLKSLFINQGFYNLFLLCAGIAGLYFIKRGKSETGYVLTLFFCFCGFGAGIVLAVTTKAYLLAFLQSAPAAIAFFNIYPLYVRSAHKQN